MEIKGEILEQIDNHYIHDDTNKIVGCLLIGIKLVRKLEIKKL